MDKPVHISFIRLNPEASIPKYQTELASGFDLASVERIVVEPGQTVLVPTGLAIVLTKGYEMQVRPRSGVSLKTPLRIANSPGTVDADYQGEIKIIIHNAGCERYSIEKGDRIAQGVIAPVVRPIIIESDAFETNTTRGTGGFGSTGK